MRIVTFAQCTTTGNNKNLDATTNSNRKLNAAMNSSRKRGATAMMERV
jgi:hypothetical protein